MILLALISICITETAPPKLGSTLRKCSLIHCPIYKPSYSTQIAFVGKGNFVANTRHFLGIIRLLLRPKTTESSTTKKENISAKHHSVLSAGYSENSTNMEGCTALKETFITGNIYHEGLRYDPYQISLESV